MDKLHDMIFSEKAQRRQIRAFHKAIAELRRQYGDKLRESIRWVDPDEDD